VLDIGLAMSYPKVMLAEGPCWESGRPSAPDCQNGRRGQNNRKNQRGRTGFDGTDIFAKTHAEFRALVKRPENKNCQHNAVCARCVKTTQPSKTTGSHDVIWRNLAGLVAELPFGVSTTETNRTGLHAACSFQRRGRDSRTNYACRVFSESFFGRGFNSRRLHQLQNRKDKTS